MHLLKDIDLISCGRSCISSSLRKHWMFMSSELLCENQSGRVSWNQKMAEYVDSNGLGQTVYLALFLSWSLRCSYLSVLSSMKVFLLWHLKLWFGLYFINFTWFGNGGMTPIQLIMRLTMIIHMNNHYFCIHNSGMIQMIILTFFLDCSRQGLPHRIIHSHQILWILLTHINHPHVTHHTWNVPPTCLPTTFHLFNTLSVTLNCWRLIVLHRIHLCSL